MRIRLFSLLALTVFAGGCSETTLRSGRTPEPMPRSAPSVLSIGSVTVDVNNRYIEIPGRVNMTEACVELLACGPGGKTHESVFVVNASPTDFQAAMLLLGLRPGIAPDLSRGLGPEGPPIGIEISWVQDGRKFTVPGEQALSNRVEEAVLNSAGWAFTGSEVVDGYFMAEVDETFVATYWDPWAIINLSDPAGINDSLIVPNPKALPPIDTEVVLRFEASGARP